MHTHTHARTHTGAFWRACSRANALPQCRIIIVPHAHAHTHTDSHTFHTHTRKHAHTHPHALTLTPTHTHSKTLTPHTKHAHAETHTVSVGACPHTSRTRARAHTYARTHAHTHAHALTRADGARGGVCVSAFPPQVDAAPLGRSERARGGGGGAAHARRRRARKGQELVRRPVAILGATIGMHHAAVGKRDGTDAMRFWTHRRTHVRFTHAHMRASMWRSDGRARCVCERDPPQDHAAP
jgi:hypothetical protein